MEHLQANSLDREKPWAPIYIWGGISAFIVFGLTLLDILIGVIFSPNLSLVTDTAITRFFVFHENWMMGLYHLDLLNLIISVIMIPVFMGVCVIHSRKNSASSLFVFVFFLLGTTVFIATNTALPMLELSGKYFSTNDETQRILYAAAGEALLVRGAHGTPGVFIGFLFLTVSNFFLSILMLDAKIFNRVIALFGILGSFILLIYILMITFIPETKSIALMIAVPGGILVLFWYLLLATKLISLGAE